MGRRFRYRRYVGRRKSLRGRSRIIILCVLVFTALVVYLSVMLGLRLREGRHHRELLLGLRREAAGAD